MDYKKILKNKELRLKILRMLSFIPDKPMLQLQYRIKMGRKLDLKEPKRFSEKLQWYKLYYRTPLMVQCVDKFDVRSYVESKGYSSILNECYGVFERVEDIDFSALPNQFVAKDTLGSGGDTVILVKDKATADLEQIKEQMRKWLNRPHHVRDGGREWPYYSGKKNRIIIEKYLENSEQVLQDYKFFCFNGKPEFLYMYYEPKDAKSHDDGILGFFDASFNLLPVKRGGYIPILEQPPKPESFEEMRQIARVLSEDFPHVRVDLLYINGEVIFGELTFTGASGYMQVSPDEFDLEMGEKFILPEKM